MLRPRRTEDSGKTKMYTWLHIFSGEGCYQIHCICRPGPFHAPCSCGWPPRRHCRPFWWQELRFCYSYSENDSLGMPRSACPLEAGRTSFPWCNSRRCSRSIASHMLFIKKQIFIGSVLYMLHNYCIHTKICLVCMSHPWHCHKLVFQCQRNMEVIGAALCPCL